MKNEEQHIEFTEQIVKYLADEMGLEERKQFEKQLASDKKEGELFRQYKKLWSGVEKVSEDTKYNMNDEWSLMEGKIDFGPSEGKVIPLRRYFVRIAAALLIGLAGVASWIVISDYVSYEQVALEIGTEEIELPDGSIVTLNAGSSIRYDVDEEIGERRVILKGEAFFEISRDTSRPFIIDAGAASVRVLGTSFNVNADAAHDVVEVTVTSGLVSLNGKRDEDNLLILNPGNSGIYSVKEKKLNLIGAADPNTVAWKTRELQFSEAPLAEVVKVLKHVYQVDIELANENLNNCPITVSFSNQELGAVLNVITNTLDLDIERVDSVIVLSGEGCE